MHIKDVSLKILRSGMSSSHNTLCKHAYFVMQYAEIMPKETLYQDFVLICPL